ncbi:hypothetical protein Salat_0185000 [Sesamum alatum]|uniref:RNase H type-1 domain-containing protein n=1 Tax=Sesamum alatum TaxID=300844 RepID=A0AAE1YYB5_9LAMI|nr:hypothetical protein Salat_0185000 [Sesamum alatum]
MQKEFLLPIQVTYFAKQYLSAFQCQNKDSALRPPVLHSPRWCCPAWDTVKINSDGAIFGGGQELGLSVIAHDGRGICFAWASKRIPRRADGELFETQEAQQASEMALKYGWQSVILESDCANLISKLQASTSDFSVVVPIVADILDLACTFVSCKFSLIKRNGNVVAHHLAKSTVSLLEGSSNLPPDGACLAIAGISNS